MKFNLTWKKIVNFLPKILTGLVIAFTPIVATATIIRSSFTNPTYVVPQKFIRFDQDQAIAGFKADVSADDISHYNTLNLITNRIFSDINRNSFPPNISNTNATAFGENGYITKLTTDLASGTNIGGGDTTADTGAFSNCVSLESAILSCRGTFTLGNYCFAGCINLKEVVFDTKDVVLSRQIGVDIKSVFANDTKLKQIKVPLALYDGYLRDDGWTDFTHQTGITFLAY